MGAPGPSSSCVGALFLAALLAAGNLSSVAAQSSCTQDTSTAAGLTSRLSCCSAYCSSLTVTDPDYYMSRFTGVGGYCGTFDPIPCSTQAPCLAAGAGQKTRSADRLVTMANLCIAKCSGAAPIHSASCEADTDRDDVFDLRNATESGADVAACMANFSSTCETDYALTCTMGRQFDSVCEAKCTVLGAPNMSPVRDALTGYYKCPTFCQLPQTDQAVLSLRSNVDLTESIGEEIAEMYLRVQWVSDQLQKYSDVVKRLKKLDRHITEVKVVVASATALPKVGVVAKVMLRVVNTVQTKVKVITNKASQIDSKVKVIKKKADFLVGVGKTTELRVLEVGGKFDQTQNVFTNARSCLQSSDAICARPTLLNGLEAFSQEVTYPTSEAVRRQLTTAQNTLHTVNSQLRSAQSSLQSLVNIDDLNTQIANALAELDKWSPFVSKAAKILKKRICFIGCTTLHKIFTKVGRILGWMVRKAERIFGKINIPVPELFDIPLLDNIQNFDPNNYWPEALNDVNSACGINFMQLEALILDFSYGYDLDRACSEVGLLLEAVGYDAQTREAQIAQQEAVANNPHASSPEAVPNLGESLANTVNDATDAIWHWVDPNQCYMMEFMDAVQCLGLDLNMVLQFAGVSSAAAPLAPIISLLAAVTATATAWLLLA